MCDAARTELAHEIDELAVSFTEFIDSVSKEVESLGEQAREACQQDLEQAQSGVLADAETEIKSMKALLDEMSTFEGKVSTLEQIYMITQNLRQVVKGLEKDFY